MADPNENFLAGLRGDAPPASGGQPYDQWVTGDLARKFNAQRLADQNLTWSPAPVHEYTPVRAPIIPLTGPPLPREAGRRVNPVLGLLAVIFVAVPLYHYSIPLWIALYPGAAIISAGVALAVFIGLGSGGGLTLGGRLVVSGLFGFVAALPLTLAEQARATRASYRHARHVVRLALIFLWAVYALTLRESRPGIGFPPLSVVWGAAWTPLHVCLAGVAVVVMHFWLSTDGAAGRTWRRLRGR